MRERRLHAAAVARGHRPAVSELGRRTVRHVRARRRRAAVRRHARRAPTWRGGADRQPVARCGVRVPVPQPGAALELGRGRRSSSRASRGSGAPRRSSTTASRRCAEADRLPPAHAVAGGGAARVSVQPRLARRDVRRACGTPRITAICDCRSRRRRPAGCSRAIRWKRAAARRRRWPRSARRWCATRRCSARPARCSARAIGSRSRRRRDSCRIRRVMADVRRYLMPVRPFTLAVRVLHSARYGADGGDPRLLSSFLGSSYFVRGHRQDLRYCRPDATRICGDDLLGNRMLVGNLEVRFPIWGLLSRQIEYGMFPIDAFVFADGGPSISGSGNRGSGIRKFFRFPAPGSRIPANEHQFDRRRHSRQCRRVAARGGRRSRARRAASALAVRPGLSRRLLEIRGRVWPQSSR